MSQQPCKICESRKPRRYCPGIRGDICSLCCGTEREVSVDCPFDCPYLQEAHQRERKPALNPDDFPNRDIRVTDRFLEEREPLLMFVASAIAQAAAHAHGAIDYDVREALDGLIRTFRTLQSGLYYDSKPANPIAGSIYEEFQLHLAKFRDEVAKQQGIHTILDTDVLGLLVFLERLELQHNNGRKKGRAFLHFLAQYFPTAPVPPSLISS